MVSKRSKGRVESHQGMEHGAQKYPRDRKREQQALQVQKTNSPTLEQACESYLSDWTSANDRGKREYRNLLWTQVLPAFGAKTSVEHFSWEYRHPGGKSTRELMTEYLGRVRKKSPSSASKQATDGAETVSYTHLTLPTTLQV